LAKKVQETVEAEIPFSSALKASKLGNKQSTQYTKKKAYFLEKSASWWA
jgi:hypothetical protein